METDTPPQNPEKTDAEQKIEVLSAERERYVTRIFWFALEIALIFLLPALVAIFVYRLIFPTYPVWYVLPFTFVLSWIIVIRRYVVLHKKLSGLDKEIKSLKDAQN
jgi:hypothetical protein